MCDAGLKGMKINWRFGSTAKCYWLEWHQKAEVNDTMLSMIFVY